MEDKDGGVARTSDVRDADRLPGRRPSSRNQRPGRARFLWTVVVIVVAAASIWALLIRADESPERAPENDVAGAAWTVNPDDPAVVSGVMQAPDKVVAGQEFQVTYSTSLERELSYALLTVEGNQWLARYVLFGPLSKQSPGDLPTWAPAEEAADIVLPSVARTGVGPDRLVAPSDAPAGSYMLCIGVGDQRLHCAPIQVSEP